MPSISGLKEVRELQIALSSQLVKDCSYEQIKEVLAKIMLKLGLREKNLPNQLETLVLYEYLVEQYGGHRLDEIPLAFNMALMGNLSDEGGQPIDANCYESFSCIYISKVMNAYRIWSKTEFKALPTEKPTEQKIFTQEELDNSAREDAERCYQMFLRNLELKYPETNRPILEKDGLIKEGESVLLFFERRRNNGSLNIYVPQWQKS